MADRMSLWTGLPQGYIQGYSPELVGLVEMMLHPNYRRRPTATLLVAEGTQKRQDEDF